MNKRAVTNIHPDAKARRYDNGLWYVMAGGKTLANGKTAALAWRAAAFVVAMR